MKSIIFSVVLSAFIFCLPGFSLEPPESEQTQKLASLVNRAATLVESKGREFFPELRKKGSEWWKGNLYVFVDGMDGTPLVYPPDPKIEGQSLLKDPASKRVAELLIETAKKGSGWVEYKWPKPGETVPSRKVSYVKAVKMPDGVTVIVGAGMYME